MNETRSPCLPMIVALAALSLATTAPAQILDTVHVDANAGSRVWIEGSSNVRDWSCRATTFEANVELDPQEGAATDAAAVAALIRRVSVKLAARDLKCGNRKMERDLYTALKANDPLVPSNIIGLFAASAGSLQGSALETHGTIAVAGVEKPVTVQISTELMADGSVKARGSVPLLMTDFGVKPPVGLFGLIRSKNAVVVKFELLITARGLP